MLTGALHTEIFDYIFEHSPNKIEYIIAGGDNFNRGLGLVLVALSEGLHSRRLVEVLLEILAWWAHPRNGNKLGGDMHNLEESAKIEKAHRRKVNSKVAGGTAGGGARHGRHLRCRTGRGRATPGGCRPPPWTLVTFLSGYFKRDVQ